MSICEGHYMKMDENACGDVEATLRKASTSDTSVQGGDDSLSFFLHIASTSSLLITVVVSGMIFFYKHRSSVSHYHALIDRIKITDHKRRPANKGFHKIR